MRWAGVGARARRSRRRRAASRARCGRRAGSRRRRQEARAPARDLDEGGPEGAAVLGELVDRDRGGGRQLALGDHAARLEIAEPLGEHARAHVAQPLAEVPEAHGPVEQLAQDQQVPAVAEHLGRPGQRAELRVAKGVFGVRGHGSGVYHREVRNSNLKVSNKNPWTCCMLPGRRTCRMLRGRRPVACSGPWLRLLAPDRAPPRDDPRLRRRQLRVRAARPRRRGEPAVLLHRLRRALGGPRLVVAALRARLRLLRRSGDGVRLGPHARAARAAPARTSSARRCRSASRSTCSSRRPRSANPAGEQGRCSSTWWRSTPRRTCSGRSARSPTTASAPSSPTTTTSAPA